MKQKQKQQKGITLIALVITIIVILILAGVAIMTLMGENGLINKTISANEKTDIGREQEQIKLAVTACMMDGTYDEIKFQEIKQELQKSYSDVSNVEGVNSDSAESTEDFEYAKVTYTSGRSVNNF